MAEDSFFNYINNNPLYVHNKLEPFLSAANEIDNNISFDFLFKKVITSLRHEEEKIYKYLSSNGNISEGKKRLYELGNEVYSNNKNRQEIFKNMQQLFGRIDSEGKQITIESTKGPLPVSVNYRKSTGFSITKGKGTKVTNAAEIQEIVTNFSNNWNSFIQNYTEVLNIIQSCIEDGTINIAEGERFSGFRDYLKRVQEELAQGASNNYKFDTLSDGYKEVIRQKVGYWGDIIGLFNEVCKVELSTNIDEMIRENFLLKRGDDLPRELVGKSKNAKADNIITIDGNLDNPEVIIPVSLKFTSTDKTKIHTGSLDSVASLISNEPEGGQYVNYFKYLLINNAYWGKKLDKKINGIIRKILQRYIYLFLSGNLEDSLYAKAIFMSSTMIDSSNAYSSHFFSIASFLETLKEDIEKNEEILSWEAIKVSGFSVDIKQAEQFLSEASAAKQLLRTTEQAREVGNYSYGIIARDSNVRQTDIDIFNKLSSLVGSKGIFMKNDYIINNLHRIL